ncbi:MULTISPECIES: ATP-binding cassette domain-containing protein [unclassified Streptomyces]|uniref:ATP-binding cassette domain-containing protein n=1 Tax=unclassified Streptomyces TaxID=2593676 RepID=UPI001BE67654|nr:MULTISPECIES: ATP-binding cassette domain-containing protein [unclassified Streptomyces]MBT2408735.1 ATP-binding cassette domain-containing protein [Streptomyces sp. ISL-21]MBT2455213.1 ATP-binding cassette domain-containing protein [Streptomyces sp. ISL-86]MBT2612478.1 ATP-binding cassette domain-containing protein [Streptomyces sp. ISL-87]
MTTTYAVLSEGLTKSYGELHALRGLDLAVPEGTVCGLLGPNGAGKTTAVRIFATLTEPTGGRTLVAGHDVTRDPAAVRRAIGVTGQYASVDGDLTGRENLRLFARLAGLRGAGARDRADELLDRFGLAGAADRVASTWSGGMKRRLDLAAGLITRPRVLFLDEPTTGLDPAAREQIWTAVRTLADEGTTVLLTTQYLEEADRLADDILVVDGGRAVAAGTPAGLKARIGAYAEVTIAGAEALAGAAVVLDQLTGGRPALDEERLTVGVTVLDSGLTLPRIIRALDTAGVPVTDASLRPPTLDEVFLRLTQVRTADGRADDGAAGRSAAGSAYDSADDHKEHAA